MPMPEPAEKVPRPEMKGEDAAVPPGGSFSSTRDRSTTSLSHPPDPAFAGADLSPTGTEQNPGLYGFGINWEVKALVPIACVLLGGMLLFLLATLSWRDPERHTVLLVAGAGAVAICGVLLVVLTYIVQRPMAELQQKIEQLGEGDLGVSVSFARRNDEIGDLGRNFNRMVMQLKSSSKEI